MDKKIANLYDAGKVDDAIHLLIEKINDSPKNIENYLQLSTYLIEQNAADQALELLEKARGLVDQPEALTYNIAVCYYMQAEYAKSLALLNSIPDDEETMYQKALIFMKLGQYQKALAYALTLKNQDERTLELLGDIWLSLGDLKSANQTYSQIIKDQRNAKVNFLLGLTLFDTNPDKAESYFKLSKEQDPKYFAQAQKQYNAVAKLIRGKNGRN